MTRFKSWSTWYHKYGSPVFLLTIIYLFPECVKWDVLQQREIVLKRLNVKGMAQTDIIRGMSESDLRQANFSYSVN